MVRERGGADASCYGLLIDGKQYELFSFLHLYFVGHLGCATGLEKY